MNTDLAHQAVSAAIKGDWLKAKRINKQLLSDNPKGISALNRYARACAELGKLTEAKRTTKKVLDIDPYNAIAKKSLNKWKNLKNGVSVGSAISAGQSFLEEPGKTKIVCLMHLGGNDVVSHINAGDEVKLKSQGHRISICTLEGKYIGRLPDDLSTHLKNLMRYGNEYIAFVKRSSLKEVRVFIKETKRAKKLSDIPSFTSERVDYISFSRS